MATIIVILLLYFIYLFINNINSNVIWSSSLPFAISTIIGLCTTFLSNTVDNENKLNLKRELKVKFFPTIIGGLLTTHVIIFFGLKADNKTIYFPTRIMYNYKTGNVLERDDKFYRDFYGCKYYQIRLFTDRIERPEYNENQNALYKIHFYDDLLFAEVLTLLFSANNDIRGSLQSDVGIPYYNSPYFYVPKGFLEERDLLTEVGKQLPNEISDIFNQLKVKDHFELYGLNRMYVPKGTKVEIDYDRINKKIIFKNRFYEAIVEVRSFGSGGGRGLGEWQWILSYNEDKNKDYYSAKMGILITVDFTNNRIGHSDMPNYRIWMDAIIKRLETHLDSELHLKNGRELYHIYKGNINELKEIIEKNN
ncbi:hypothetical protein JW865_08180 [Candidatus Bathyarchaeota archaeon]|nr:hypothetical protein [Candidatus Bathyarchaeota archaeon]